MTNREVEALETICRLAKNWIDECYDMEDLDVIKSWEEDLKIVKKILTRTRGIK